MMAFIRDHQLNIMLFMSGMCAILAVMTMMPKFMSRRRRNILFLMEVASMLLLLFDRYAYIYRGNTTFTGTVMVRISNGLDYFLILFIPYLVSHFVSDLLQNEGKLDRRPKRFIACDVVFYVGSTLVLVSQFTGLYYTFDDQNQYQRAPLNFISYIFPFLMVIIQESVLVQYRKRLTRGLLATMTVSVALPMIASVLQFLFYGISLISMTMVLMVAVFYIYTLCILGAEVDRSKLREIQFYKDAQKREAVLFEETAEALISSIEAKDNYTRGHSTRVAVISSRIAKVAGYTDQESKMVYFAALLHDIGKIGVPDDVINKRGALTEKEFDEIKMHTVYGGQILSSIKEAPYLSVAARSHHERYDGKGYPDGLSGEFIPEIARIIAVADAYDAMTSSRIYRDALSAQEVKNEIISGIGTQFDKRFAEILLELLDKDGGA